MRSLPVISLVLTSFIAPLLMATPLAAKGGTLKGAVSLNGAAPTPGNLEVTKDQQLCGEQVADETLLVKGGKIQNVVVSIEGVTAGPPADAGEHSINNVDCRFVPHVQSIQAGATVTLESADGILHNTNATYENGQTVFNIALPFPGVKIPKRIRKAGVVSIKCDAGHTWMSAYVVAFDHPYHAVTAEDGSYTISGIPAGSYTVTFWHEKLPSRQVEVTIEEGKTQSADVELEGAG